MQCKQILKLNVNMLKCKASLPGQDVRRVCRV